MFGYGLALLDDVSLLLGWCNYDFSPNTLEKVLSLFLLRAVTKQYAFVAI
jgi:hypothetical protein